MGSGDVYKRQTQSIDTDASGKRDFTYDARGNVTKIEKLDDPCLSTKELTFGGTGGTNWVHTATINSCENKVVSLVTKAHNDNLRPVDETFRFTDITVGSAPIISKDTFTVLSNATAEVQVKASYAAGNILTIEHRAKPSGGNWSPWIVHGDISDASAEPVSYTHLTLPTICSV